MTRTRMHSLLKIGGEGGDRTHGPVARTAVFETARFGHSRTSPQAESLRIFTHLPAVLQPPRHSQKWGCCESRCEILQRSVRSPGCNGLGTDAHTVVPSSDLASRRESGWCADRPRSSPAVRRRYVEANGERALFPPSPASSQARVNSLSIDL